MKAIPEAKFRTTCRILVNRKGSCRGIDCRDCPGYTLYNKGNNCTANGWAVVAAIGGPDPKTLKAAKRWLARNPEKEAYAGWSGELPEQQLSHDIPNLPTVVTLSSKDYAEILDKVTYLQNALDEKQQAANYQRGQAKKARKQVREYEKAFETEKEINEVNQRANLQMAERITELEGKEEDRLTKLAEDLSIKVHEQDVAMQKPSCPGWEHCAEVKKVQDQCDALSIKCKRLGAPPVKLTITKNSDFEKPDALQTPTRFGNESGSLVEIYLGGKQYLLMQGACHNKYYGPLTTNQISAVKLLRELENTEVVADVN